MIQAVLSFAEYCFISVKEWITEMKEKKADKGFEDEGFRGSVAA